ncbi:hypothetical protein ElyMa_003930100, partial [Elysia marginata]
LKNTMSVMSEHISALSKQLSALKIKTSDESKAYNEHLSNYTKTRDEYMAKYRAFPMAVTLEEAQKAVLVLQDKVREIGESKSSIVQQVNTFEAELATKVMTRIVVKIVQSKVNTQHLESEIHECVTEKTVLLEQLRELQKSKQQDQQEADIVSESNSKKVYDETDDEVFCDADQAKICNKAFPGSDEANQIAKMCLEDTSSKQQAKAADGKSDKALSLPKDVGLVDITDVDGDVTMTEDTVLAQQQSDPATHHATELHSQPHLQAIKQIAIRSENQGRTSDPNSIRNFPKSQFIPQNGNLGLGKRQPRLSVPRMPSLSRISPALRMPSLTVPRPYRVQQPRITILTQKKISSVTSSALTSHPEIKQPIPPPLQLPTPIGVNCINLPTWRERPSFSSLSHVKGIPQQKVHIPENKIAKSEQNENQETPNEQRKLPHPQLGSVPPKDVCSEAMVLEEEKDDQGVPNTVTSNMIDTSEGEENGIQACRKRTTYMSTPVSDRGDVNGENEPLFRLDHTFGSQGTLGKSASSQPKSIDNMQQQSQHSGVTAPIDEATSQKSNLITELESFTFDNCLSPDADIEKKGCDNKSFFSLFNRSGSAASERDPDTVEERESFGSIFNFANFATGKSNNDHDSATDTQEWSGPSGLLGIVGAEKDSTDEVTETEPFSIKFGLLNDTEEENANQSSFFNFGGGNFNSNYTDKPTFNLF